MKVTSGRCFEGTLCSLPESTCHVVCLIMNFRMDSFPPLPLVLSEFFSSCVRPLFAGWFLPCSLLISCFLLTVVVCLLIFSFSILIPSFCLFHHWPLIGQLPSFYVSLLQVHSNSQAELVLTLNSEMGHIVLVCCSYCFRCLIEKVYVL